ncbi:MAG: SCO family protein [Bacteroidales bacterium]|nr:SCO family protein [Bacteroidales bacterium]
MVRFFTTAVLTLTGALLAASGVSAQTYGRAPRTGDLGPPSPENVGIVQQLGAQVPLDLSLTDHDGQTVTLREVVGAKPTVLVLHYNRCPKLCNEVIQAVLGGLNDARRSDPSFVAGGPFNVVFVSIDPRDAPAAARMNRQQFHTQYDGRSDDQPGIWFLTTNHGQGTTNLEEADRKIHQLAEAVGFRYILRARETNYRYDAETGQWMSDAGVPLSDRVRNYDYQHSSGIMLLTPEGSLSKYLLGLTYSGRDLRLGLVDASGGKIGTVTDQIAQFCFVYDPISGHYRLTMRLVAVAFTPFMLFVMFLAYRTLRSARTEQPINPPDYPEPGTAPHA